MKQPRRSPIIRSFKLEAEVRRLISTEQYELAVLVSQTLLELRIEAELAHFVEHSGDPELGEAALSILGSYNLGNPRTQRFFEQLVGVKLKDRAPKMLRELKAHVERRNRIAHRGDTATREEAHASLRAVLAATEVAHILALLKLGMDDDLEEEARQRQEEGLPAEEWDDLWAP